MGYESPIHDRHAANDAFFIPYGPEQSPAAVVETFGDLDMEYAALRKAAVLFDAAHTGTIRITGGERLGFLNNMVTRRTEDMTPGTSRRCFWLNRKGRIDADLLLSEFADEMLVSVDRHLAEHTAESLNNFLFAEDVQIEDVSASHAHLWLIGPKAIEALCNVCDADHASVIKTLVEQNNTQIRIHDINVSIVREDLAGVPGLALIVPNCGVADVYAAILDAPLNKQLRVRETGWLAINTARIESGSPMFNIDFGTSNVPAESGIIDQRVEFDKGCYLGQEVVARMHARNARKQAIVAIRIEGQRITGEHTEVLQPAAGAQVFEASTPVTDPIGVVTSSTIAPMLGAIPICFAMLKDAHTAPGTKLKVFAEGAMVDGVVQPDLVFYSSIEQSGV